jgi:hypothetical protein
MTQYVAHRFTKNGLYIVHVAWGAWLNRTEKDPCPGDEVKTADRRLLRMSSV